MTMEERQGCAAGTPSLGLGTAKRGLKRSVKSVVRAYKVYRLALVVYLDYRRTTKRADTVKRELGLPDDEAGDDHPRVEEIWHETHERNAQRVYESICDLRGLWVKAGQFLSSRPDIVPMEYVRVLSQLQDSIPPRPWSEVETTLREELGSEWRHEHFSLVDQVPISTASIAQVHRAVLVNGDSVALKVMHRGVRTRMLQDLHNMKILTNALAYLQPDQDYRKIVGEWRPAVKQELNLLEEAENLKVVARNMADHGVRVKIPAPRYDLCTCSLLVMDFCEGFSPKNKEMMAKRKVDKALFMQRLVESFAVQIHLNGFYHADPHPGNILISTAEGDDPSVPVLLDFGLVKSFPSAHMKQAFSKMVYSSFSQDLDQLAKSFVEMGLLINKAAQDPVRDMVNMRRLFSPTPISKVKERKQQMAKEREAKKKEEASSAAPKVKKPVDAWPSELVFFIRVTGLLKGLCSTLDLDFPYLEVMASKAIVAVREAVPKELHAESVIFQGLAANTPLEKKLEEKVREMHSQGRMMGLQCTVVDRGSVRAQIAAGQVSDFDPRPVREDTLFNIFSVAKAFLAASCLKLVEEGAMALDDPVSKHWPAFGVRNKAEITVKELISHEAGLAGAMPSLQAGGLEDMLDFKKMVDHVATAEAIAPGSFNYHAISYAWLVGGLVASVSGVELTEYMRREILAPLGLEDSVYNGVPREVTEEAEKVGHGRLASVSNPAQFRESGRANPRLESALANPSVFNMRKTRESVLPSANSHMSAGAIAKFYAHLFEEEGRGETLLSRDTMAAILAQAGSVKGPTLASAAENSTFDRAHGLGFQVMRFKDQRTGEEVPVIGHLGFGGSAGFVVPSRGVAVGLAVNALDFGTDSASASLVKIIADHYGLNVQ